MTEKVTEGTLMTKHASKKHLKVSNNKKLKEVDELGKKNYDLVGDFQLPFRVSTVHDIFNFGL
jgi:hypothetical protein